LHHINIQWLSHDQDLAVLGTVQTLIREKAHL